MKYAGVAWAAIGRWWTGWIVLFFVGLAVLYFFEEVWKIPLLLGSLVAAEVTPVVRYGINDWWVFRERRPSWARFCRFHVVSVGGFLIWWVMTNLLAHWGVYYMFASAGGTAGA